MGRHAGPLYGQGEIGDAGGFVGEVALGFIKGLSYDDAIDTSCYNAAEGLFLMTDNALEILKKIYLPRSPADLQIETQSIIATGSNMYVLCGVTQLFHTFSTMLTTEGIASLVSRVLAAYPFQI